MQQNIWKVKYTAVRTTESTPGPTKLVQANSLKEALVAAAEQCPTETAYLRGHAHVSYIGPMEVV